MKTKFYYYQDPGHAWAAVPVSLLEQLGIVGKISAFSYWRGKTAYLEEDCDLAVFFDAYRAAFGTDPVLVSKHSDDRSPIRSYARFTYSPAAQWYKIRAAAAAQGYGTILEAAAASGHLEFITLGLAQEAAK